MVKVRMNTADVASEVKCLRRLIGMRCANVYDISPKTYLFKLMNSSGVTESGESEKVLLLMESGIRLHTTAYVRDKSTTPSGFTLKLRKHIRTRRLEDVRQLGYDRIIIFQFGIGANAHYIILELYSQGNILLTDADFTVLTLLRSHRDDDKGIAIMSRHRYPMESCRVFERTISTKLKKALTCSRLPNLEESLKIDGVNNTSKDQSCDKKKKVPDSNKKSKDGGRLNKFTLKAMLGEALGYGPALSEHIILDAGLLPSMKVGDENNINIDDTMFQSLLLAITKFEDWLTDIMSGYKVPEGYILMQNKTQIKKESALSSEVSQSKFYDDVCPILLSQLKSREFMKLETFDAALDEFYSKIESQRVEQQQRAKEGSAVHKLDKIRSDQENRVHTLKKEVDHSVAMALLIEYNLKDVDAAILAVRVALANGMDWEDLFRMVKEERKSGNPVAGLIDKLHLERNCITLLLSNNLDDMDEDELTRPVEKVEVDLSLSAHANARHWYDLKKKQEIKQEKTVTAHDKAFKAAERKTRLQLAQEKTVAAITHIRKVHWFEKFNWFITSENYLVISGRDAQQNEMIVKRYMSKGDLYIHADLHGAPSTVIKNHKPEQHVPPLTLNQVGCYTVCQSQAWDSKMVTSAWWVYPHQVSKTAPTGEYLTVGSFIIRGKKNFLPPHPLVMGFGILFRLDESSLALHLNERRVRGEDEEPHDVEGKDALIERNEFESQEEFQNVQVNDTNMECTQLSSTNNFKQELNSLSEANNENTTISSRSKSIVSSTNPDGEGSYKTSNNQDTRYPDISVSSISSQLENLIDNALEVGSAKVLGKDNLSDTPLVTRMDNHGFEERNGASKDKIFISKAERRKLKKIQDNNNYKKADIHEKEECSSSTSNGPKKDTSNSMKTSAPKITRGQKGKLKKIKEKYAMQDDEERRIRMALLASAGKFVNNEKELDTKEKELNNKDGTARKAVKQITEQDEASKICYKCKKLGHLAKDCQENTHKTVHFDKHVSNGRDIQDHEDTELKTADSEMDKITIDEDDIHEIGEDEKVKLNDVDYLTGNPLPNDILLYAVPVCGPYNALQTYKYRVKITPGTARKGKAAKIAMNLFGHTQEASTREKELMKACTDPELVAAMIGNSKITAPGLTQLKRKQKKGKNQEKKLKNPKPISS